MTGLGREGDGDDDLTALIEGRYPLDETPAEGRLMAGVREELMSLVGGSALKVQRVGEGPQLLLLHGEDGTVFLGPFVETLASSFEVIVPIHPGWHGSNRPGWVRGVREIADVYAHFLDVVGSPLPIVGLSFGAWVAAELAMRDRRAVSSLVLVAPIGVKIGDRETRDFLDIYANPPDVVRRGLYGGGYDPIAVSSLSDEDCVALLTAQEATARMCWEPYMHDPTLKFRLERIDVPTLIVAGEHDGVVLVPGYFEHYASLIGPSARTVTLPGAGHRIEEELPAELASIVGEFVIAAAAVI